MTPRPTLDELPDVLTLSEVAFVFGVSTRHVSRLRRSGQFPIPELPGIGHAPRFAKSAVARYLDTSGRQFGRNGRVA